MKKRVRLGRLISGLFNSSKNNDYRDLTLEDFYAGLHECNFFKSHSEHFTEKFRSPVRDIVNAWPRDRGEYRSGRYYYKFEEYNKIIHQACEMFLRDIAGQPNVYLSEQSIKAGTYKISPMILDSMYDAQLEMLPKEKEKPAENYFKFEIDKINEIKALHELDQLDKEIESFVEDFVPTVMNKFLHEKHEKVAS